MQLFVATYQAAQPSMKVSKDAEVWILSIQPQDPKQVGPNKEC